MAEVPVVKISDAILNPSKFKVSSILPVSTIAALGSVNNVLARKLLKAFAADSKLAESTAKFSAFAKSMIENPSPMPHLARAPEPPFFIVQTPANPMPALTRDLIKQAEASHLRMIEQNEEVGREREERRLERLAEARRGFWSQALNIFLALVSVGSLVVAIVK